MTLPIENYLAAFPPVRTVRMGWLRRPVVLGPLTLGKCIILDAIGIDANQRIAEKDAAVVAFVLSEEVVVGSRSRTKDVINSTVGLQLQTTTKRFHRFERRVKRRLKELCKAVNETCSDAFRTYVKPPEDRSGVAKVSKSGVGWWLSYAESLCDDYGWTWREALDTPFATAFALVTAHRERYNAGHGGPDYIERIEIAEELKNG